MLSVIDTALWLSAVVEFGITVGAVVSVVEEELSVDADEPPSSLIHEIMKRIKISTNEMCKIFSPIINERRRFEELLSQNYTNRLSIQFVYKCGY